MRILILGTGGMANQHAANFSMIEGVSLVGGVDVVPERLAAFCSEHGIARQFSSFEDALKWGEFDAVANVTPDSIHHPTTMQAIAAGKHVFCEKPLATDATLAMEMTDAIEKSGKVGMVNFTYRNSPALQKGRAMVLAGEIGSVRHVEASHLQSWLVSTAWGDWKSESKWLWRLSTKHGSNGALGDIGIHIVDFASYGSGLDVAHVFARLKTFDKAPGNVIGDYVLDANDSFTMNVDYSNGAVGTIQASRTAAGQFDQLRLRVYGDLGSIEVIYDTGKSTLRACVGSDVNQATWREIACDLVETNFQRFAAAVKAGETQEPSFRRAANIQKILDGAVVSDREHKDVPTA
ncbi:Gfo/Idh/MocA family oxidoreductase [Devosia rhodophyticola]|uniref:Gfo/Idh/MocA family oxidoreductase n=1 Tax=Devosia rhodophyticola TaxID=3026423 RepID=A0ABY7Z0X4_9HYPH|nr:Gfo/Idh/MocA family oxidoreductase [Devosia rhodophyticola]WDR06943.1 Gfo/Idh/MocA family oxidoreductase [Devosia rhodophyticola]